MQIVNHDNGLISIEISTVEKNLITELTDSLLLSLESDDPSSLTPRLFPIAILDEPEMEQEYQEITESELRNAHRKSLQTFNLITSGNKISIDEFVLVIKGLNIVRLELGEELNINDELQSPPNPVEDEYRTWIIFQHLGQMLFECVSALESGL